MDAASHDVDDLPGSTRFVARMLQDEGPMDVAGLAEATGLSRRSVHRALDELEARDFIRRTVDPADTRRRICRYDPSGRQGDDRDTAA